MYAHACVCMYMCMCAELGKNLYLAVLLVVAAVCAAAWVCEKSIKSINTITPTPNDDMQLYLPFVLFLFLSTLSFIQQH